MIHKRTIKQFGDETFNHLINHTILIVGVGGVGGYAVEALARFGFKKLILIDDDTVEESNINRQLCALYSTVGLNKVDVFKSRINDINKEIEVIALNERFNENSTVFNDYEIDFVIDAIDSLKEKTNLIEQALDHDVKIISVMGTGNKVEPESFKLMPLHKTSMDPIARILRRNLKTHDKYKTIQTVCSIETPKQFDDNKQVPASNSFVPASAGLLAASYIIRVLTNQLN